MKTFLERGTLQQAERILADRINVLPPLPPLGPSFKSLTGTALRDALVVHRIRSQFSLLGSDDDTSRLEAAGVSAMLSYDNSHEPFSWRCLSRDHRATFIGAQGYLADMMKSFKPTYRVRFPKNETYVSASGDTSLYMKLADISQWTVSADAIDYATKIIYGNAALKGMLKRHFREQYSGVWRTLLAKWRADLGPITGSVGFAMIKRMFKAVATIVGVSRLSSVPKNNTTRRVITLEPLWNMVCQLSMSLDLRDCLLRQTGFSLSWLQTWHRSRISSGDATIDFSNASNSNWWDVIRQLWPAKVVKHLQALRTGIVEYKGEYYPLHMMAPMGCGFTFEVMTMTLWAYARQFCPRATVFGDDVIISPEAADAFVKYVVQVGWRVNDTKSFTSGSFRESCGAFYDLDSRTYLVSYDFPPLRDHMDLVVTLNKLRDIWLHAECSADLREWMVVTWVMLSKLIPTVLFSRPAVGLQGNTVDYKPMGGGSRFRRINLDRVKQWSLQLHRRVELCHVKLVKPSASLRQGDGVCEAYAAYAASMFALRKSVRTVRSEALRYEWVDDYGLLYMDLDLWSGLGDKPGR